MGAVGYLELTLLFVVVAAMVLKPTSAGKVLARRRPRWDNPGSLKEGERV